MPGELTHGEIDPRFDAIIAKAMQTNREARYQSASAIRKDLDIILTTPRIKQDASQAIAAVPQGAVKNVPGQRSIAQKPGAARVPKKMPRLRRSHHPNPRLFPSSASPPLW